MRVRELVIREYRSCAKDPEKQAIEREERGGMHYETSRTCFLISGMLRSERYEAKVNLELSGK